MTRFRLGTYTAFALSFVALLAPHVVFGATNFLPIVAQPGTTCYCVGSAPDYGCVMEIIQRVINAAIELGVIICVAYIGYAGFSLMLAQGNPQALSAAKTRLLNAALGMAIILSAWIVVDFAVKAIYKPDVTYLSVTFGPWNQLLAPGPGSECIKRNDNPDTLATGTVTSAALTSGGSTGNGGGNGPVGSGSCTAPANGPCSIALLSQTCFGGNATVAAGFCNKESGGNPANTSRTDILADGNTYSVGLFQTNLTNSYLIPVNGQQCSTAFTGACQGTGANGVSHVVQSGPNIGHCDQRVKPDKMALYTACVAQARSASGGVQAACSLSKNGTNWSHWSTHQNGSLVPECQTTP
ncbi:MAG: hypothetical protein JWL75_588 [Parcubacteria group bacterium]|nr:hypothetical protein [Parcubacteria group bacterium]